MQSQKYLRLVLILATLVLVSGQKLQAQARQELSFKGLQALLDAEPTQTTRSAAGQRLMSIPTLSIQGHIPLEGAFRIRLNQKRISRSTPTLTLANGTQVADKTRVELLRGSIQFRRGKAHSLPIAAALLYSDSGPELSLTFRGLRAGKKAHTGLYLLKARLHNSSRARARISRVPAAAMHALGCGTEEGAALHAAPEARTRSADQVSASTTYRVVAISTDADSEWFSAHGSNSNAEIAAVLDAVEVIYKRDLGVDFDLISQNVFSSGSPYTATNSSTLLGQFRTYALANTHLGSADLYHLFTGKDMDGSTVGIAYVGVLCASSSYSYGVSQNYNRAILTQIVAHELGHNFDANHDTSSPDPGIMAPSVSGATAFSALSIAEMNTHMATYPSCLGSREDTGVPTPTPTASPTPTATLVPTATATASASPTASAEPSISPTPPGGADPEPSSSPDPDEPGDDLDGASLALFKTKVNSRTWYLQAIFGDAIEQPLAGYSASLLRSSGRSLVRVGTKVTDADGLANFKVRYPGYYRARILAGGERFVSERIRVR